MNTYWKSMAVAFCVGGALLFPIFGSDAKEAEVTVANPISTYESMADLEKGVGFRPLFMPNGTFLGGKYQISHISSISGNLAEVQYKLEDGGMITIRSEKFSTPDHPDVSGVYTGKWKEKKIGDTKVDMAKISKHDFVARWSVGNYGFAVIGNQMNKKDFNRLVSEVLVDYSQHIYGDRNPLARNVNF